VNTEPLPSSLVTVTSPPIMRLRVMARPSPVPPKCCAVEASAWVNSSNSFACCHCEATLDETLSDPIVRAVMEADGIDPRELAATLRGTGQMLARRERRSAPPSMPA
jgi:hypothetical protein